MVSFFFFFFFRFSWWVPFALFYSMGWAKIGLEIWIFFLDGRHSLFSVRNMFWNADCFMVF